MTNIKIDPNKDAYFESLKEIPEFSTSNPKSTIMKTNKKNWPFKGLLLGSSAILAALGTLYLMQKNPDQNPTTPLPGAQKIVASLYDFSVPTENLEISFSSYTVKLNENENTIILLDDSSRVIIPPNTLRKSNGDRVTGNITLTYRSFKNLKEVIQSGIPMYYDSSGTTFVFESAGMFELYAYQNDKMLQIEKGKNIQIDMSSDHNGNYFNQYYLDPQTKQWAYIGKDTAGSVSLTDIEDYKNEIDSKIKDLVAQKPISPKKRVEDKPFITLNFDKTDYPELDAFKEVSFQIKKGKENLEDYTSQKWSSANINRKGSSDMYTLCFSNKTIKDLCFETYPVVKAENFSSSSALASEKLKAYKEKIKALKKAKREAKNYLTRKIAELQDEKLANQAILAQRAQIRQNTNNIYRPFQASGFGIYNSDYPRKIKGLQAINLTLKGENNKVFVDKIQGCYLADKSSNVLYGQVVKNSQSIISFMPESESMIVLFTTNNKVYYYPSSAFSELEPSKNNIDIHLKSISASEFETLSVDELFSL